MAKLPPGYRIEVGGAVGESAKGSASIMAVIPVMFLIMLFILMLQLHSTQKLLLVMLTAPLAIIGVALALLISNRPFGFVAMLGVFALVGMIIRNSVVLMAQIKENEDAGMERGAAIVDATMHRLRPILLTAAAAILGLIPIVSEVFWGPMAIAMMGGLFIATVLTLIFLPALYASWYRVPTGVTDSARGGPPAASMAFDTAARGSTSGNGRCACAPVALALNRIFSSACSMPSMSAGSTQCPRRCRRATRAARRPRRQPEDGPAGGHVVVDLVRRRIGHVIADHREQHVRALQLGEQSGERNARPLFDEPVESGFANALPFGGGQRAVGGHVDRPFRHDATQALAPRAAAGPANGCRRSRPHARSRCGPPRGGGAAAAGVEAIRHHEVPARLARAENIPRTSRACWACSARAPRSAAPGAPRCDAPATARASRGAMRPVVGAPRIAVVEDQRPTQSPRDARAGDQRRVRRRGGDDDAAR